MPRSFKNSRAAFAPSTSKRFSPLYRSVKPRSCRIAATAKSSASALRRLAPALVCAAQMSAEHHDHFVDNQAWKLKRTIRERQHHPGPMKNHVILGSRGAMQVANALLLVLATESIDNGPWYIDVNRVET